MALINSVYISNVDNLSDARYSAGMGVDLIGFRLDPHDDSSLSPEKFKEISEWISGVKIVGEFGDTRPDEVEVALDKFKIDYLLISDESQINAFSKFDIPLILSIIVNEKTKSDMSSTFNYCSGYVEYFLLESELNKLDAAEKSFVNSCAINFPIILGYGLEKENVKTIVNELQLQGISLKGSSEIRPGYKNFDEMADILEVLEVD